MERMRRIPEGVPSICVEAIVLLHHDFIAVPEVIVHKCTYKGHVLEFRWHGFPASRSPMFASLLAQLAPCTVGSRAACTFNHTLYAPTPSGSQRWPPLNGTSPVSSVPSPQDVQAQAAQSANPLQWVLLPRPQECSLLICRMWFIIYLKHFLHNKVVDLTVKNYKSV